MDILADILGIECPVCGVPVGHYCDRAPGSVGHGFPSTTHRERVTKAQEDAPTPVERAPQTEETQCPWCKTLYVDGKVTCACYGMEITDWKRIAQKAGPNSLFPGQRVYLFMSEARAAQKAAPNGWMKQFRSEAEAHGATVAVRGGHIYVVYGEVAFFTTPHTSTITTVETVRRADGRDILNDIHEAMDDEAPDGDSGDYDV